MTGVPFDPARIFSDRLASIPRAEKRDYRGVLNLSSNELHHPRAIARIGRLVAAWQPTLAYPYYPDACRDVAALSGVAADACLLAAGGDAAIKWILDALTGAGTSLVIPLPAYEAYSHYAVIPGVRVVRVPHRGVGPDALVDALLRAAEAAPPAVIALASPDGFTGEIVPMDRIERLAAGAAESGSSIVVDEAYGAFAPVDHTPLVRLASGNVVVLRTFSKSLGLAALRIAAIFAPAPIAAALARMRPSNPVTALSAEVLVGCLRDPDETAAILADVRLLRARLAASLSRAGIAARDTAANFVTAESPSITAIAGALADAGIVIRDLSSLPGFSGCARITVPGPDEIDGVERALAALGARA